MIAPTGQNSVVRVLVVDDEKAVRAGVRGFLEMAGYEVEVAEHASAAMRLLTGCAPDVVLSDITMPGLSGVDLLREIRRAAPDVQVIMMTGAPTIETASEAVRAGAADYLTKPVNKEGILRSVGRAAQVKRLEDESRRLQRENESYRLELEARNEQLDALVRKKSRQLAAAHDRLVLADRTKLDFLRLISHELRTPAHGLFGIAGLVFDACRGQEGMRELRDLFEASRARMMDTLDGALLLAQIQTSREEFKPTRVSLSAVLADAHATALPHLRMRGVGLDGPPACFATVIGNPNLLRTALSSLLETAGMFAEEGRSVVLRCVEAAEGATLRVRAAGRTLAPDAIPGFFEVFGAVRQSSPAEELGLKPAVAERIVSLFGGSVRIENVEPPGVELTILLPITHTAQVAVPGAGIALLERIPVAAQRQGPGGGAGKQSGSTQASTGMGAG
ncbi:MAG: response regulator [Verrucomicrobiales bacterium]|nr:response regulator [Verrucomicrobiales bacterium]